MQRKKTSHDARGRFTPEFIGSHGGHLETDPPSVAWAVPDIFLDKKRYFTNIQSYWLHAAVAELADARDLKSLDGQLSYRFDSGQRHHKQQKPAIVPVFSYLSEEYRIDLLTEVEKKIALNGAKYPVEKAKGSAKKYSKLD